MAADNTADSQREEENNILTSTRTVVKEALDKLGYPNEVYELFKDSLRMIKVRIPVRKDDGAIKVFTGFSAQHNDAVGPTKGGVRFHPEVTETEVNALAIWMTLKEGIVDLPYCCSKGDIICDLRVMSFRELEALIHGYVLTISQFVGPTIYIPAPDVFTNSQIMSWIMD